MADTWAGTPDAALCEEQALADAEANGIIGWKTDPGAGWDTSHKAVTWDTLATYVNLDAGHPTGSDCPTKAEVSTWATPPVNTPQNFSGTHNSALCPNISIDLSWTNPSGYGAVAQTLEWRGSSTDPWTVLYNGTNAGSVGYTHDSSHLTDPVSGFNYYRLKYDTETEYATTTVEATCFA